MESTTRTYAQMIADDAAYWGFAAVDVRHIEGWMRVEHSKLDHLTREQFRDEVRTSAICAANATREMNEEMARFAGV